MRVKSLFLGDVRFQFKYGFYFLYLFFSLLYIGLLYAFPVQWKKTAAILMIFSDPAAMGLYFMGAIVLFEKSERVLNSIAISPVKAYEYVLSKLCSIGFISVIVALAIGLGSQIITNAFYFITGVFLCSCLFSAIGLIVACKISTLNQFVVATIPFEILINLPAIAWLFGYKKSWLLLHPGVCLMELCSDSSKALPAFGILLLWTLVFAKYAERVVKKMMKSVGGVKL